MASMAAARAFATAALLASLRDDVAEGTAAEPSTTGEEAVAELAGRWRSAASEALALMY